MPFTKKSEDQMKNIIDIIIVDIKISGVIAKWFKVAKEISDEKDEVK